MYGRVTLTAEMNYLGIDIGGSKTLIAVFDEKGDIIKQSKFPTDSNYDDFIKELEKNVAVLSTNTNIACSVAIPGLISRDTGVVHALGNLDWRDKPIRDDISKALGLPVIIENDARLGGLAEARELIEDYDTVLYLTISTGIGGALLRSGDIVKDLQDTEMGKIPLLYEGKIQHWEDFAGGRAIVERYNKRATDIDSPEQWEEIGERISYGVAICCSILQPQAIVFGGGVGQSADKFKGHVKKYLQDHLHAIARQPEAIQAAKFGENSVIHGCFALLKHHGLVK